MSTDLIAELRAALDDHEATVRATRDPGAPVPLTGPDPLADIAAKRAVIDAFEAAVRSAPGAYPPDASGLGQAVRLLAEAYGIRADGPTI